MRFEFTKMHGLGNDFVMVEDLVESLDLSPDAVAWLCDRNFGIGGDGLILIRPASVEGADYFMLYYNADGTTAEMCGNGIRCFAKYVVDRGLIAKDTDSLAVQTLGGVKPITVTRDSDGTMAEAIVDMGMPVLDLEAIPAALEGEAGGESTIETKAGTFRVTAVSMGNPHAIIWVDDVASAPVCTVGPLIETHRAFPAGTNVGFVEVVSGTHIRLRVWERGVGETLACGTGACAAVVAGTLACRIEREATVELPGGDLQIRWDSDDRVYMAGPATEVFRGFIEIPEDEHV